MKQLKTITAAVLLAATSGAASAAMYTPAAPVGCQGIGVTIPCERSAWDIGIEGIYVQSSSDASNFFGRRTVTVVSPVTGLAATTVSEDFDHDSRWGWGFKLEGSYHFGTGNDININWTHFKRSNDRDDNLLLAGTVFSTDLLFGFDAGLPVTPVNALGVAIDLPYTAIFADSDVRFDAVNAEFGQHVDYGEHVNVRYHAGLQFARVRDDFGIAATRGAVAANVIAIIGGVPTIVPTTFAGRSEATVIESRFNGVGPRIGADAAYSFGNGFSLVGRGAAALLVGTTKAELANFITDAGATVTATGAVVYAPYTTAFATSASHRTIVPALEARLGAKYDWAMASGDFVIEGGWLVQHYGHAVLRPTAVSTTLAGTDYHHNNFGFQGPYLGVKWIGNA